VLQWLIHFLQGPVAKQCEPSPLHQFLMEQECKREEFASRTLAQIEAKRVQFVRDGRLLH
jgi:hypothetical protein